MKKKVDCHYPIDNFFQKDTFSLKNELLAEKRRVEPQVMVKSYMNLANTLPWVAHTEMREIITKIFTHFCFIRLQQDALHDN